MKAHLNLLKQTHDIAPAHVLEAVPQGHLFACDFYINGIEENTEKPWGYEQDRIINIDHHAPTPRMSTRVSSTNLALLYVEQNGTAKPDETVVINHTDCDSVLSAAIVRGEIEPLAKFGDAAIAADHTGEENDIADLLQALDPHKHYTLEHYAYSLRCLRDWLEGRVLPEPAQVALGKRKRNREQAAALVAEGRFDVQDGIAWAALDDSMEGEFFPALLPEAKLIVIFVPRDDGENPWNVKCRLGLAAPDGFSLEQLVKPLDRNYGGRWNAGSNKRGGGTPLSPGDYMEKLFAASKSSKSQS